MRKMMFAAAVAGALVLALGQPTDGYGPSVVNEQGGTPDPGKAALKSAFAIAGSIKPLTDAFFAFEDEAKRNNGKAPKEARVRVERLKELAGPAKSEIRSFVARLRANNEAAEFDALALERGKPAGALLINELKAAGGATALLARSDTLIDQMIADRQQVAEHTSAMRLAFPGVAVLEASSVRAGVCAAIWYVATLGYGERFAYRSCYY